METDTDSEEIRQKKIILTEEEKNIVKDLDEKFFSK